MTSDADKASELVPSSAYSRSRVSSSAWLRQLAFRGFSDCIGELWAPKFAIGVNDAVSTYGSCFAQHIGRNLQRRGFHWFIPEAGPKHMTPGARKTFNYGIFSTRTGNIYTTSLLLQWLSWADGSATPPDEIWEKDGRYYDPFRPTIEPDGFANPEELRDTRQHTIECFKASVEDASVFVFTLGLTESWFNSDFGYEYPICPGTAAGAFDESKHVFINQSAQRVRENMDLALTKLRTINPDLKVLLTVSPVPLTATRSTDHVLVATTYSKSVLRSVAGELAQAHDWVDYFPSYEIITAPTFKGQFFEDNQRNVAPEGVAFVMQHFFTALGHDPSRVVASGNRKRALRAKRMRERKSADDLVCEEVLLDAFGSKK